MGVRPSVSGKLSRFAPAWIERGDSALERGAPGRSDGRRPARFLPFICSSEVTNRRPAMSKGPIIVLTLVVLMAPAASARPVTPPRDDLVPVYRLYNPDTGEHLYTRDTNEADVVQGEGFFYEGAPFLVSRGRGPGDAPLYRFYRPDVGHMYGTDPRPPVRGSQLEGVMG